MTDFTVNRPGDQSPLSATRMDPTYGRLSGHMSSASIGGYPSDYVASLTGALGSLDLNAMRSFPQPILDGGLQIPTPDGSMGGHSPDFGSDAARQFMANGLMGGSPSGYSQAGYGSLMGMPVNSNIGIPSGTVSPNAAASAYGMPGYFPMMQQPGFGFPTQRMTGNYGPAAAAAAAAAAGNLTGRTVYIGNIPDDASADELLNLVRFGPIESVKILSDKSCVFISFLDGSTAAAFYADAAVKKLALRGQELRIGWGRESNVPTAVAIAVNYNQATRNVFIGNLNDEDTEQTLRDDLARFGDIDQIKIVRDKNIAFVHFLSISVAMKVVNSLPREAGYKAKRVGFGKDRCAYVPRAQQAAVRQAVAQATAAVQAHSGQLGGNAFNYGFGYNPASGFDQNGFNSPGVNGFTTTGGGAGYVDPSQMNNRSIYLGNISGETSVEELCNNIRGGVLESIKVLPDKKCAFVMFVDPAAALSFYRHSEQNPITIAGRRLRIGWGKALTPVSPKLLADVQQGASRNVYIGQITDFDAFNADKLRADFSEYGDIELINFFKEKHAAYVNFTSIEAAQKAITAIKQKDDYASLRIAHGKDRCGYPPRQPRSQGRRETSPRANSENDPVAVAIATAEANATAAEESPKE
jgi:RNA recognition motif-containing protein